jgi:hypothetical protein
MRPRDGSGLVGGLIIGAVILGAFLVVATELHAGRTAFHARPPAVLPYRLHTTVAGKTYRWYPARAGDSGVDVINNAGL